MLQPERRDDGRGHRGGEASPGRRIAPTRRLRLALRRSLCFGEFHHAQAQGVGALSRGAFARIASRSAFRRAYSAANS